MKNHRSLFKCNRDMNNAYNFSAVIIIILGTILTVHKLDLGIIIDEQYQLEAVRLILSKGIPLFPSGMIYARGLGFSYFSALFALINQGEVTEFVGRLPSVIYFSATGFLIWLTGKRIFNPQAALFSLIVFCFTISMIFLGKFARGYMGLAFYSLLGVSSFYRIFFLKESKWIWGLLISFVMTPLYHVSGIWIWGLLPFMVIKIIQTTNIRQAIIYLTLTICLIIPLVLLIIFKNHHWSGIISKDFFLKISQPDLLYWIYFPIFYPVTILIASLGWFTKKNWPSRYFYLIVISLLLISSIFHIQLNFKPRYINWLFPIIALLFGYSLDQIIYRLSSIFRLNHSILIAVTTGVLIMVNLPNLRLLWGLDYGVPLSIFKVADINLNIYPDYKTPALYVKERTGFNDTVISIAGDMMHYFYLQDLLDYQYVWWQGLPSKVQTPELLTFTQFQEILQQNKRLDQKTWVLTEFRTDPSCQYCIHENFLEAELKQFLADSQSHVVYVGKDKRSKVYLF